MIRKNRLLPLSTPRVPVGSRCMGGALLCLIWMTTTSAKILPDGFEIDADEALEICTQESDPITGFAVARLSEYVELVTGRRPVFRASERPCSGPGVILKIKEIPYYQADGFRLISDPKRRQVEIISPTSKGFPPAVQALILRMEQGTGHRLTLPRIQLERNPWVKGRELFIAEIEWHPTESEERIIEELQRKFSWLNWDLNRLRRYVELIHAMGYNAIMMSDSDQMKVYAGQHTSDAEGLNKVQNMMRYARDLGMNTSFFIWGQRGLEWLVEDPRDPAQYADMRRYWELMIDRYGPLADKWILHWADPGGCEKGDCTVNTPQALSNRFFQMLRGKGFQTDVSFSLWGLRWGNWPGYRDWRDVVHSGILDPEIGINLMRNYRYDAAKAIADQYRHVGVWGWYLNDIEVNPGLHVHSKILENEFARVHPTASVLLDWYSLEDNNHLLNLPSLYVGGQMLWDRQQSGPEALQDFCRAVWGSAAQPVFSALQALERVRSGPGVNSVRRDLWPHGYLSWIGRGTDSPEDDLAICKKALRDLEQVRLDPEFVPKLPLVIEPKELLEQIRAHLDYVTQFASIRVAYQKALDLALSGRFEQARDSMTSLPTLPDLVPGSYGALEYGAYQRLKKFAESWEGRNFSENLALGKAVQASSWYKQDPRFAPEMVVNGLLCEFQEEGWAAHSPGPAWVEIDLGSVRPVRSVRIYNRAYTREHWDNNLIATPEGIKVFYAVDSQQRSEKAGSQDNGYRLLGTIQDWTASNDPADFREVRTSQAIEARFIKVVVQGAAGGNAPGTCEIEVR